MGRFVEHCIWDSMWRDAIWCFRRAETSFDTAVGVKAVGLLVLQVVTRFGWWEWHGRWRKGRLHVLNVRSVAVAARENFEFIFVGGWTWNHRLLKTKDGWLLTWFVNTPTRQLLLFVSIRLQKGQFLWWLKSCYYSVFPHVVLSIRWVQLLNFVIPYPFLQSCPIILYLLIWFHLFAQ